MYVRIQVCSIQCSLPYLYLSNQFNNDWFQTLLKGLIAIKNKDNDEKYGAAQCLHFDISSFCFL